MASAETPSHGLLSLFNEANRRIHILVDDYSYELLFDGAARVWWFESEVPISGDESDRRRFDAATAFPAAVRDRVRDAARFVRAYYEVDVDDRIGVEAFERPTPFGKPYH